MAAVGDILSRHPEMPIKALTFAAGIAFGQFRTQAVRVPEKGKFAFAGAAPVKTRLGGARSSSISSAGCVAVRSSPARPYRYET